MTSPDAPRPDRALVIAQKALAGLMADAGFAVPAKNRDEQWDAPVDEAASILGTMLARDLVVLPSPESRADPDAPRPDGQAALDYSAGYNAGFADGHDAARSASPDPDLRSAAQAIIAEADGHDLDRQFLGYVSAEAIADLRAALAQPEPLDAALRDFVSLLPADRWDLLRPETQATVDARLRSDQEPRP